MNVLFICTHNRCRSILCEAITNQLSDGSITAFSAGSEPAGSVHPLTLKYLKQRQIPVDGLVSESWDAYQDGSIDLAITVCDSAAAESCPIWLGDCPKIHWGLPDPTRLDGSDEEIETAFIALMDRIEREVLGVIDKASAQ